MRRSKPSSLVVSALAAAGLVASALGLSACSSVAKTLGVVKSPPDEYAVSRGPELVVPPDFALRPPGAAAGGPEGTDARELVLGAGVGAGTELSPGELALLREADAVRVDPRNRTGIDEGRAEEFRDGGEGRDTLLDWLESGSPAPEVGNAPPGSEGGAPSDLGGAN